MYCGPAPEGSRGQHSHPPFLDPAASHSLHRPSLLQALQEVCHPPVCVLHVQFCLHRPSPRPHSVLLSTGAVHQHYPRLAREAIGLVRDDGPGVPV